MKRTPIRVKTETNCRYSECGKEFKKFRTTDKYCCKAHEIADKGFPDKKKQKAIPKFSKKREIENATYSALRIEFLSKPENRICPITKEPTTEIHHKWSGKDRAKYFLDTSTWLAISREGHIWIHENSKEARENGFLY